MINDHTHQSHPNIIKRLKRANGHLESVIGMMDQGKPCLELAQQLHAVEKAIQQAKRVLVQDHIEHNRPLSLISLLSNLRSLR